jgi:hypothetical protein
MRTTFGEAQAQRCPAGLGAAIELFRAMDMQTVLARAEAELSAI